MKEMIGLLFGRFQPIHNGHVDFIKYALEQVDTLYIGVGSAEKNHSQNNPFSASERYEMISKTIISLNSKKFIGVIPIPDCVDNNMWVAMIESYIPKWDIVFTNEPLSKRLFKEKGYEVRGKLFDRDIYSGTIVREKMAKGLTKFSGFSDDDWKNLVPKEAVEVIVKIDGVNRLKELQEKDC